MFSLCPHCIWLFCALCSTLVSFLYSCFSHYPCIVFLALTSRWPFFILYSLSFWWYFINTNLGINTALICFWITSVKSMSTPVCQLWPLLFTSVPPSMASFFFQLYRYHNIKHTNTYIYTHRGMHTCAQAHAYTYHSHMCTQAHTCQCFGTKQETKPWSFTNSEGFPVYFCSSDKTTCALLGNLLKGSCSFSFFSCHFPSVVASLLPILCLKLHESLWRWESPLLTVYESSPSVQFWWN